ncbi:methylthioribulose 1-phosphate dehydratase [Uliginosibacterium gangwonense]|uniref:methylthioribulose 1-phosphate dehydratase n=1 Tax=Uliginosibacterium gangwonense TaxID=392736 RepID=UPI00035F0386|nr:methylthioribulose 1-phosphate dehydratase [Uliginosibacterium gangwonense]
MNAPDSQTCFSVIDGIIEAGRFAHARGWVPATSGNFSARIDANRIAITRTGRDKGNLTEADIAVVDLQSPLPPGLSAEAPLHVARYQASAHIGAIFHIHSPASAFVSRVHESQHQLLLHGWELEKAIAGVKTHEAIVLLPIFPNNQDTVTLAASIEERLQRTDNAAPGYLLAGHGLYAWGHDTREALRHIDALEHLIALQDRWNSKHQGITA